MIVLGFFNFHFPIDFIGGQLTGGQCFVETPIEKVMNDNEQFSRLQNVRVKGFVEEDEENCAENFCESMQGENWFGREGYNVDRAHRGGKKEEGTNRAIIVKPWSNGHASSRKLKTWGYLRLRLARPCVHLR